MNEGKSIPILCLSGARFYRCFNIVCFLYIIKCLCWQQSSSWKLSFHLFFFPLLPQSFLASPLLSYSLTSFCPRANGRSRIDRDAKGNGAPRWLLKCGRLAGLRCRHWVKGRQDNSGNWVPWLWGSARVSAWNHIWRKCYTSYPRPSLLVPILDWRILHCLVCRSKTYKTMYGLAVEDMVTTDGSFFYYYYLARSLKWAVQAGKKCYRC